jgi:thiamine-phosphate pyrophosphorylase
VTSPTTHPIRTSRPLAGLHVLVDDSAHWKLDPVKLAREACRGGARVIQLRCKRHSDAQVLHWGLALRKLTREADAALILNDRFDLALLCEADGVHLGQDDLPPASIPSKFRSQLQIGRSTHCLEQVREAAAQGLDYIAFGPLFGTTSKQSSYEERGLAALTQVCAAAAPTPVIAIGGIDSEHLASIRAAGAAGFAVIGAVAGADDPGFAAQTLHRAWSRFPTR